MSDQPMDKAEGCRVCGVAWGLFGIIAGSILLAMGVDLVTGGALTRMLAGTLEVVPDDDN